jgi:hypothetical protein
MVLTWLDAHVLETLSVLAFVGGVWLAWRLRGDFKP